MYIHLKVGVASFRHTDQTFEQVCRHKALTVIDLILYNIIILQMLYILVFENPCLI